MSPYYQHYSYEDSQTLYQLYRLTHLVCHLAQVTGVYGRDLLIRGIYSSEDRIGYTYPGREPYRPYAYHQRGIPGE